MTINQNTKRIAKNTLFLYTRQIVVLIVSLYTVRVVLDVLGIQDYGIYSVVGGIVTFFTFLKGTMSSATQRFFSFALGQNDLEKLNKIFSTNWVLYASIGITGLILLETLGLWFVNQELNVPTDRLESARLVFHYTAFGFVASIFTTPFMAIIIAHEDMHLHALVSVFESALKLGVVFLLVYLDGDKLRLYGILLFCVSVTISIIYICICLFKYEECQFRKTYWDKEVGKEVLSFTSWTLFGRISNVARNQAVTVLLNQAFNPVVVAARAVAVNITTNVNLFANSFNVGLYPSIIKSYASGAKNEMYSLIYVGSRITFFLMWVFSLPMLVEIEMILNIWLIETPPSAALFTRLALIEVLINSFSLPLTTAARAPGKMRNYELILGTMQISIFPLSYLVVELGLPAYSVFVVAIIINVVMFFGRVILVAKLTGLPVNEYFRQVVLQVMLVMIITSSCSVLTSMSLPDEPIYSALSIVLSILYSVICMYFFGLNREWRKRVREQVLRKLKVIR